MNKYEVVAGLYVTNITLSNATEEAEFALEGHRGNKDIVLGSVHSQTVNQ